MQKHEWSEDQIQSELVQMEEKEKVNDFFTRLGSITNLMARCGESLSELKMWDKIMSSLYPIFDYIVGAIEESKDISTLSLKKL